MAKNTAPSFLTASFRIFDLSLGQMLWSRRTIFMALVVGLPVVVGVAVRLLVEAGVPLTRVGRETVDGTVLFGLMVWGFFVRFAVPVLAMFYGTSLIADEVEDKTITYLFTRPIRREAVYVGKYLAFASNRASRPGTWDTNLFVASWIDAPPAGPAQAARSPRC